MRLTHEIATDLGTALRDLEDVGAGVREALDTWVSAHEDPSEAARAAAREARQTIEQGAADLEAAIREAYMLLVPKRQQILDANTGRLPAAALKSGALLDVLTAYEAADGEALAQALHALAALMGIGRAVQHAED